MEKYNRIILIGNGFDLAHGLKTSYKDFYEFFINFESEINKYNSEFLSLAKIKKSKNINDENIFLKKLVGYDDRFNPVNEYIIKYEHTDFKPIENKICKLRSEYFETIIKAPAYSNETVKSKKNEHVDKIKNEKDNAKDKLAELKSEFSTKTLETFNIQNIKENTIFKKVGTDKTKEINWFHFENVFWKLLNDCLKAEEILKNFDDAFKQYDANILNNEIEEIKRALEFYLNYVQLEYVYTASDTALIECKSKKILELIMKEEIAIGKYLFLTFNYTPTEQFYKKELEKFGKNVEVIHIHGELNNKENPMIFGYGDEDCDEFKAIEKNDNKYRKHIKSINYIKSQIPNYQNLLNFIRKNEYEVYVMGHSCDVCDKTTLRKLFEHEKCKKISIFYHKDKNNFDTLAENIHQIFIDKESCREKVNYNKDDII